MFSQQRTTEHRDGDDLLTAGLGLEGLRAMLPPAFADADHPTPRRGPVRRAHAEPEQVQAVAGALGVRHGGHVLHLAGHPT